MGRPSMVTVSALFLKALRGWLHAVPSILLDSNGSELLFVGQLDHEQLKEEERVTFKLKVNLMCF